MGKNIIPTKKEPLFATGEGIAKGLSLFAGDISATMVTEPILRNVIITAEAGVRGFEEARDARRAAYAAQAAADEAGIRFIVAARSVLALYLGNKYSERWGATGFPNQSTGVPDSIAERQTLLRALQNFFANHSAYENVALGVTAVLAGIRFSALSDARAQVNRTIQEAFAAKEVREAALFDLRRKIRGVIDELSQELDDDDDRWYAFGLNPPAAPETPEIPEDVELTLAGPGGVNASWTGAPRADRYRVFKQVVGVDAEPVPVETVYDTQFAFTGLTAGQTLKVFVSAGNDAGVSDLSEAAEIVVQ